MKGVNKYAVQFFEPKGVDTRWMNKSFLDVPPVWCSVDLRDGNQSLVVPMSVDEKLAFFELLCEIGFKEIEIGFPAASETEYEFCRTLIERGLIPDDVTIQVLSQAREHILEKTFEAIDGAKRAIVHMYSSTSFAQRESVYKKSKQEMLDIAVNGAKLCAKLKSQAKGKVVLEYSPESFTATEPEFALEVCNAVLEVWKPTKEDKAIIDLPSTVAYSMPHVYANQVAYISQNLAYRDGVTLSLHPHNDRGSAVADTEMALLAGGERVEGTLFGNGERAGNVDLITLALNMYSQGVDPKLDFSFLPKVTEVYERVTRMRVAERQPYAGRLVFASFSGSHQDAITKALKYREENGVEGWNIPYLPIDPADIGRKYDADVIRINSQSGKGGIGYILETKFKLVLPPKLREVFSYHIKSISDHEYKELLPQEVYDIFMRDFVNKSGILDVRGRGFQADGEMVKGEITVRCNGEETVCMAQGHGRVDCVCNAIIAATGRKFTIDSYVSHAIDETSSSEVAVYLSILSDNKTYWGTGIHEDVATASIKALVGAVNGMLESGSLS